MGHGLNTAIGLGETPSGGEQLLRTKRSEVLAFLRLATHEALD